LAVGTSATFLYKWTQIRESEPEGGAMSRADPKPGLEGPLGDPARAVLFATDGSDHALKAARFLADMLAPGTEIHVLTVLSMELDPHTYLGELSDAAARRARIEEETELAVGKTRRILQEAGHTVTVRQRFGNPPDETLSEVNEFPTDLVVVGRRGLGRTASLLLGSVSSFLLRHSPSPVLVVP
jgi:nucleotide-binding universal stress UspA family protein